MKSNHGLAIQSWQVRYHNAKQARVRGGRTTSCGGAKWWQGELIGLLPVDYCDNVIGYIFMNCTPNHYYRYCVALPTDEKQPWPGCTIPTCTVVYPVCKRLQLEYLAINYEWNNDKLESRWKKEVGKDLGWSKSIIADWFYLNHQHIQLVFKL